MGFDKPLAWNGTYPTLGVRRAIQYSKGALFMAQLRVTLGDAAFWSGLRRYTRDHAGGTVTSIELKRAMEEASGRDLRPLFAEWVRSEEHTSEIQSIMRISYTLFCLKKKKYCRNTIKCITHILPINRQLRKILVY